MKIINMVKQSNLRKYHGPRKYKFKIIDLQTKKIKQNKK